MKTWALTRQIATLALAAMAVVSSASTGQAATGLAPLKALQAKLLAREPMSERREARERHEELRKLVKQMKKKGITQFSTAGLRLKPDVIDEDAPLRATQLPSSPRTAHRTAATAPPVPNKRANNPTGDVAANAGQSETSIVAWGNKVIAAWNDGEGFATPGASQGYATSIDGGITWVDRGNFPVGSIPDWEWTSDPVLTANEKTGAFYFTALFRANALTTSGVGIIKGRMNNNGTMAWGAPVAVRTVSISTDFIDKQWVVADSVSGKVYLTYTRFPAAGSVINFQASADSNVTSWGSAITISNPNDPVSGGEAGLVQGSRPIVAGDGTVYVQYYRIGLVDVDFIRVRRSTNAGGSFSAAVDAVNYYTNYGSGAPGFNRPRGIESSGLAIDRSTGPGRGRIYLSLNESLNWYDDALSIGAGGTMAETESNGTAATADAFTLGQILSGNAGGGDSDYYSTALGAGQSLIFKSETAPGTGTSNVTMRLFATDGVTRLAFTTANADAAGIFMFTAPAAGTYFFRVAANGATGPYSIKTGLATRTTERGRDQRDVFVTSSDNGTTWTTPVRVSQSPVGFDDWLPEVAVDANGRVYCTWFDFRDAAAATNGGQSNIYMAFSDDAGSSWSQMGASSDATSDWTNVTSNIQPNQGDYIALFANATNVFASWGDGRDGNPNVYVAPWTIAQPTVTTALALVSATALPGRVELEWFVDAAAGFEATVERAEGGDFIPLGVVQSDSAGSLRYTDSSVVPGNTYRYRLAVIENGLVRYYGAASLTIPIQLSFALGPAFPNPAPADFTVSFALASSEPATLSVVDVAGRVVLSRSFTLGAGRHVLPLSGTLGLAAGVYLLRLEQGDRSLTQRISLVR